jgi:signal transduction histidine kinase
MKEEEGKNFLAIQVTDSGGGIAAEDLPRVFARRYRAEHSLIKGVGDTGVGLSIAKTLAEAQGGRIWVDTQADVGSTYSVLLPVEPAEAEA